MPSLKKCAKYAALVSLISFVAAAPSANEGLEAGVLPLGAINSPGSQHLVIRGVVGGRKKRYVIERQEKQQCCREKTCGLKSEIMDKDCRCKKCDKPMVPGPFGRSCQSDCPSGQEKFEHKNGDMCCDKGTKPSEKGDKCEEEECEKGKKKNKKGECEMDCGEGKRPDATGKNCEDCPNKKCDDDDVCEKGMKKNTKGECEMDCGEGKKPDASGKKCEDCPNKICDKDKQDEEEEKKRRGKCKEGEMMDPIAGGQTVDTPDPKCVPDDHKKCKKGEIPESRWPGDVDPKTEIKCAKIDDKDKKDCNPKKYYVKTSIDMDGKATQRCEMHDKFKEKKQKEAEKQRPERKKKWDQKKPEREEKARKQKEKDDEARRQKEEMKKKADEARQKSMAEKEKKKSRLGRCLPLVALFVGMYKDLKKRDGEEHPYDWTTEYFSEEWMEKSDDVLEVWPEDVNVNDISPDDTIDNDEWMKKWNAIIERNTMLNMNPSRTMQWKRCDSANGTCDEDDEFVEEEDAELVDEELNDVEHVEPIDVEAHITQALALRAEGTVSHHYEKRFLQILFGIAAFAARLAINIAQGVAKAVVKVSDRVAKIVGKGTIDTKKLFQLTKQGSNNGKSFTNMKDAAKKIKESHKWKDCIKGGKP